MLSAVTDPRYTFQLSARHVYYVEMPDDKFEPRVSMTIGLGTFQLIKSTDLSSYESYPSFAI